MINIKKTIENTEEISEINKVEEEIESINEIEDIETGKLKFIENLIQNFQKLEEKKIKIIDAEPLLQQEIVLRLITYTKKDFFLSVVNINPDVNKKFSFKYIQEKKELGDFLVNYRILNGFFKFLNIEKNIENNENKKEFLFIIDKSGDLIQEIVNQYIPLIKRIIYDKFIKKYSYMSANFDELYAGGLYGLIAAIYKYDSTKGAQFITHAYRWIIYYIHREMNDVVQSYNTKLYENEYSIDSNMSDEELLKTQILNEIELKKIMNTDIIDNYERYLIEETLLETLKFSEISGTIEKLSLLVNSEIEDVKIKQNKEKMIYNYLLN